MGCLVAAAAVGCASSQAPAPAQPSPPDDPAAGLEDARMPFRILELPGGREISWEDFVVRAGEHSAVCVGEQHGNPHHHWAQLQVVAAVLADDRAGEAALGMEMFQRPFQGVLDDYAAGRIDEATMLSRAGWETRWGYDYALYRPSIDTAVDAGAELLALNAPRELVRKVSREGFEALTPSERSALPELDLNDEDHKAWFVEVMEGFGDAHPRHGDDAGADDAHGHDEADGHGHHEANAHGHHDPEGDADAQPSAMSADDRLYAAQVIWDETMAEVAAEWLSAGESRLAVLIMGAGHCQQGAVVSRIERRGDFEAASVLPIIDTSDGRVADLVAGARHDFLFVLEPPEGAGH